MYCLKFKGNTESINPKVSTTGSERTIRLSKCPVCNSKNSKEDLNSFK